MDVRHYLRHFDYLLLLIVLALVGYGITMVYFATRNDPALTKPSEYAISQLIFAGVGLAVLIAVSLIDYELYRRWQWALYGVAVAATAVVLVVGEDIRGARRWIHLPFMNLQPSALALWILAIGLSAYVVDRVELLGTRRITLQALVYLAVPAALVFREPDLGTTTVILVLGFAILFFFGTNWTHFAAIFGSAAAIALVALTLLPVVGVHLIEPYQFQRLVVFVNKESDPGESGYNVIQSMIAVGSGSLTGRGDQATQTTLDFLPEHHTDFIFAVIGERYGFFGAVVLLMLYMLLVWRALRIATMSRDFYGSVIAGSIAVMFLYQAFVNIGMTIGIMPVTGIPLPFVSYGGSALITSLMFIGLLESIHTRAKLAVGPGRISAKR